MTRGGRPAATGRPERRTREADDEGRHRHHRPEPARHRHVSALDEQFAMTRLARDRGWEAVGANFLFVRTHWLGMPLAHALASMRLMSDELLPALGQVKG
jgi:hypothetical protein